MTSKAHTLLPLILITLTACSTSSYEAPHNEATARVRFTLQTSGVAKVRHYQDQYCNGGEEWLRLKDKATPNKEATRLGMPLWRYHNNSAKELAISSGSTHHFLFKGQKKVGFMAINCAVPVTARFKKDRNYELRYSSGMHTCHVELREINTSANGNITTTAIQRFKNSRGINSNNCFDNFKHQAAR